MDYRRLGKSDLNVSAVCLGTMTFGEQNTEAQAHAQLDYAFSQGVNFIDTAELYPVPTRAEVSDVATAVFEGADAIMLSAESAAGKFPVEAVQTMNRIGEEVERDPTYRGVISSQRPEPEATAGDAIADAARQIAETLDLSAIICWTDSGSTAMRVARERPHPPVVAITPNVATGRKLAAVWGVHCVIAEDAHDQDDMIDRAARIAFRDGFAKAGQRVIIVAGVPLGTPGTTNMVRIAYVGPDRDADI